MEAVKESSDTSFVNSKLGSITEKHGGSNRASTLLWVSSSIGLEHMPDTHEVAGSSPAAPTNIANESLKCRFSQSVLDVKQEVNSP